MSRHHDEEQPNTLAEALAEVLDLLQFEMERQKSTASSIDENPDRIDVERAWDCGKECGYLEAVADLLQPLSEKVSKDDSDIPADPSRVRCGNFRRVIAFLKMARLGCREPDSISRLDHAIQLLLPYAQTEQNQE
jgi:hypothetical protein